MYWLDRWIFDGSIEYEYKYAGSYGARGEPRAGRRKPTSEEMLKLNQNNKEKKMRRLIKANFSENDYWCTLKYPKGTRKSTEEVKKDFDLFLARLRRAYKAAGFELKFIYRLEIGTRGGIHAHFIINRIPDGDLKIQKAWNLGRINFESLYETGGYKDLAEYLVKPEKDRALSNVPEEERKTYLKTSSSRNLIRPKPERKQYRRWTLRRLIENGIKPTDGYAVDKNSIVTGINPFTGMSYLQYTEIKLKRGDKYARDKSLHPNGS